MALLVAGSFALLALSGCASNEPEGRNYPVIPVPPTQSIAVDHIGVSADFEPASDWKVIRESDRTKPSGTKVHNIRWDTGDKLLTVDDIKALFDKNGYTLNECFEQIGNCTGTAPVESGTVDVSMTATAWTNSETKEVERKELSFETSMD